MTTVLDVGASALAVNRVRWVVGKPDVRAFTVFVCSTFDDLEREREGVRDAHPAEVPRRPA